MPDAATSAEPGTPESSIARTASLYDDYQCCICMELLLEPVSLACGHSGCHHCFEQALSVSARCPSCREGVARGAVPSVNVVLRSTIERLFPEQISARKADPETAAMLGRYAEQRRERNAQRAEALAREGGGEGGGLAVDMSSWLLKLLAMGLLPFVVAPYSRTVLLLQNQRALPLVAAGPRGAYSGLFNVFWRQAAEQGALSYWRGAAASVLKTLPIALFDMTCASSVNWLCQRSGLLPAPLGGPAARAIRDALSFVAAYPLEVLRLNMTADVGWGPERRFFSLLDCTERLVSADGSAALYTGCEVGVARLLIFKIVHGVGGQWLAQSITSHFAMDAAEAQPWARPLARLLAAMVTYPLDLVRTRMVLTGESDFGLAVANTLQTEVCGSMEELGFRHLRFVLLDSAVSLLHPLVARLFAD